MRAVGMCFGSATFFALGCRTEGMFKIYDVFAVFVWSCLELFDLYFDIHPTWKIKNKKDKEKTCCSLWSPLLLHQKLPQNVNQLAFTSPPWIHPVILANVKFLCDYQLEVFRLSYNLWRKLVKKVILLSEKTCY